MKELDRLDRETSLRNFDKRHQPKKTHRAGSFLVALLLLAGASGVVYLASHHSHPKTGRPTTVDETAAGQAAHLAGEAPSPGVGEHKSRILPVATAPRGSGGYSLLNSSDGPPRYDPCRPIHYVIRDQDTPPNGDQTIRQAVAAVSKATGLEFINDGTTTEKPSTQRPVYQPSRYGNRWAPVLIAWTNPSEISQLKGKIEGIGGSASESWDGEHGWTYVSGYAYLDAPQLNAGLSHPHGDVMERLVIEHELGHLVGLGHVNDRTQIMNPEVFGLTDYRAGDLRGLAYEGSGACHPEL